MLHTVFLAQVSQVDHLEVKESPRLQQQMDSHIKISNIIHSNNSINSTNSSHSSHSPHQQQYQPEQMQFSQGPPKRWMQQ
jgi:hypothetical protein